MNDRMKKKKHKKEGEDFMEASSKENIEGQETIEEVLKKIYPFEEPFSYGTIIPYALGGPDPLDRVAIYKSEKGMPHWHYITFGFSEIGEKESENSEESGYGFELTFRLKREGEERPPIWPVNFLQNLARYVFETGNVFRNGHHMNANGPIALEEKTELSAIGFQQDPELGELNTSNGHLDFIQVVGLTQDEMTAIVCWDCKKFLHLMSMYYPFNITDLSRTSLLKEEKFYYEWQEGIKRDGSSTAIYYTDEFAWKKEKKGYQITFGAGHVKLLCTLIRARLEKGREFLYEGREQAIFFKPGKAVEIRTSEFEIQIVFNKEALNEFYDLLVPKAGIYIMHTMPLKIELVQTKIRDRDQNIVQVIG